VNAVESIFVNEFGWLFREQHVSDWGIDAHVEVTNDGAPTGFLFAVQIKAGASYFKKSRTGFTFQGKPRHLDYWENHSLPVLLVLADPESGLVVCQLASRRLARVNAKSWSIDVPAENVLTAKIRPFLLAGLMSPANSLDVPYRRFLSHIATLESPRSFLNGIKERKRSDLDHSWALKLFDLLRQQITADAELIKYLADSNDPDVVLVEPGDENRLREDQVGVKVLPAVVIFGGYGDSYITDYVTPYVVARRGFLELLEYLLDNQDKVRCRKIVILPERYEDSWESYPDGYGTADVDIEATLKKLRATKGALKAK
jgi:hypothetical protein